MATSYLLFAVLLSIISTNPDKLSCQADKEIYITSNGLHLDIVLPKTYLKASMQQSLQINEQVAYFAFGWGDSAFYVETPNWRDLKITTAVRAVFLPSKAAVHVTNYGRKYDHWLKLSICASQLETLIDYIDNSFEKDKQGSIIEIKNSGYTQHDSFYEGTGKYTCILTSNEWVNQGLKKANIQTSLWSPFDFGVLYQIKKK